MGTQGGNVAVVDGSSGEVEETLAIPTSPPRVGDLNGDGMMEIAMGIEASFAMDSTNTQLKVYTMQWIGWGDYFQEQGIQSMVHAIADIDNDGFVELIGSPMGKQMRVYRGNPFSQVWSRDVGIAKQAVLGDFDGDGVIFDVLAVKMIMWPDGDFITKDRDMEIRFDLDLVGLSGINGEILFQYPKMGSWSRKAMKQWLKGVASSE